MVRQAHHERICLVNTTSNPVHLKQAGSDASGLTHSLSIHHLIKHTRSS